jgi:hypothetical protein
MRITPQSSNSEQLSSLASLASARARQGERVAKLEINDVGSTIEARTDIVSLSNRADATLRLNVLASQIQQSTMTSASVAQSRLGTIDSALSSYLSGDTDGSTLITTLANNGFVLESTDPDAVTQLRTDVRQGLVASSNVVDQRQRALTVLGNITVESLGGADAVANRLLSSITQSPQQAVGAHQLNGERVRALLS